MSVQQHNAHTETVESACLLTSLHSTDDNGCRVWKDDPQSSSQQDAITVETTAYALLTAVAHQDFPWADNASCWLVAQENYGGGFMSTQVTWFLHGK